MEGLSVLLLALLILGIPLAGLVLGLASRSRVHQLERRVQSLEAETAYLHEQLLRGAASPVSPPAPTPTPTPTVIVPPAPLPRPVEPARPAQNDPHGWHGLEGRLGGTWLSRVGALAVTVGIGFFLKYAFDNGWIQPAGRVAVGVATGLALVFTGERLQRAAYRVPAQALVASGIAALYLSVYAAYAFYQLITQPAAFGFMVLVTATALALAIHHDARAIAVLANLGGFLTPVLLSTNRDAAVALFTYLAILDAGMVASAYWRRWTELHALSFAFTHLLYFAWFQQWYVGEPPPRAIALVGASVFVALFSLVALIEAAARERLTPERLWQGPGVIALAAPAVYFAAARAVLWPEHAPWLALLCLVLAAYYVGLARVTSGAPAVGPLLLVLHGAIALGFLTLTFPIQFAEHGTTIAWSVEGVVLVWGGLRLRTRLLRIGGLIVLVLGTLVWIDLIADGAPHHGMFVADDPALLSTLVYVVATAIAARLYRTEHVALADLEHRARPWLAVASVAAAAVLLSTELYRHSDLTSAAMRGVTTTLVWLAAGALLLSLARTDRTATLAITSAVLLVLVGVKAALLDTAEWRSLTPAPPPLLNARFGAGLLVTAVAALYARLASAWRLDETTRTGLRTGAMAFTALFLLWHLSAEVVLAPLPGVAPGAMTMARHMALSILWTVYAFVAIGVGIHRRLAALRFGAMALFGVVVVKVFLLDLARLDAGYRILSFLVLGAVLIVASFMYTRFRDRISTGAP